MLANQKMIASISTDRKQHWLGDGVYLYREMIYAFWWILLMYKDYFGDENEEENLLKKYSILDVDIDYDTDRIFNLDNPEHYMVFKETERAYKKKSAFSSKLEKYEYTDGVIINIMFKNLKYGEKYDAVEAVFPIYDLNDSLVGKSRIKSMNEYQICIKNNQIIRGIKDITDVVDFGDYYRRFVSFEKFKRSNEKKRSDASKYVNSQRSEKNGQRKNFGR